MHVLVISALYFAAFLAIVIGVVHSVLGERFILIRLFKRNDLPKLFGSTEFTANTLRFAWHITTIAWWGFAALLVQLAKGTVTAQGVASVIAITFLLTGVLTLVLSKAKHLAWIVFFMIGGIAQYVALKID